ncbi:MAG TPA: hypothetical protein VGK46_13465 [Saprospiraceae bacterium]
MFFLTSGVTKTLYSQADSLTLYSGFTDSQEAAAKAWLDELYSQGVTIKNDSVYFNDETRRIVTDTAYQNIIYPDVYTWEVVPVLLQNKAIKPAVWYLINLYHADTTRQDLVLKTILPMDQVLEMDRVMVAAFYTYIAFDPEVYTIVDGKTVSIKRPDLAEQKLIATKAIVDQILNQRIARQEGNK